MPTLSTRRVNDGRKPHIYFSNTKQQWCAVAGIFYGYGYTIKDAIESMNIITIGHALAHALEHVKTL